MVILPFQGELWRLGARLALDFPQAIIFNKSTSLHLGHLVCKMTS